MEQLSSSLELSSQRVRPLTCSIEGKSGAHYINWKKAEWTVTYCVLPVTWELKKMQN